MKYRCAILAFGSLMSLSAFAGYEEGLKAYKNKDYAQALQEWRPLAEQGDARSQYSLGCRKIKYSKWSFSDHSSIYT